MIIKFHYFLLLLPSFFCSCTVDSLPAFEIRTEVNNPWSHLHVKNDKETFQFAIVSDRTAIPTQGVFESAIAKLNYLQPDFVMSVGDLVEGYTHKGRITDLTQIDKDWTYITQLIHQLDMPFFYTVGNNDINAQEAVSLWDKRFGRTYYHFLFKNVLFLIINTDDPPGTRFGGISNAQFSWLSKTLNDLTDPTWTFIFMHRPVWNDEHSAEVWNRLRELLRHRSQTTLFAGHVTEYRKDTFQGIHCYTLAKTGSFSPGQLPPGNDFDHIMWVTMTRKRPVIANLMLSGIYGDNPAIEAK